jgi:hypothetical protein
MSGKHARVIPATPAPWENDWLTATEARGIRSSEAARPIGMELPQMARSSYYAMEAANTRAERVAIIRKQGRARLATLGLLALIALGIAGLALTDILPTIG